MGSRPVGGHAASAETASVVDGEATARWQAAVLGDPIEHSLSPLVHTAGYNAAGLDDWRYTAIRCPAGSLARLVDAAGEDFLGFSVTMPGKVEALDFADHATARALAVGSANTLVRTEYGWRADNTDVDGIHGALDELGGAVARRSITEAVVVGAGGTARAAVYTLTERGVRRIHLINRTDRAAELRDLVPTGVAIDHVGWDADLEEVVGAGQVLVSTVPAGVVDPYATRLGHLPLLDVVYDPHPTKLCVAAASNGFVTVGGQVMLFHQALSQFEQFTGHNAPRAEMRSAIEEAV